MELLPSVFDFAPKQISVSPRIQFLVSVSYLSRRSNSQAGYCVLSMVFAQIPKVVFFVVARIQLLVSIYAFPNERLAGIQCVRFCAKSSALFAYFPIHSSGCVQNSTLSARVLTSGLAHRTTHHAPCTRTTTRTLPITNIYCSSSPSVRVCFQGVFVLRLWQRHWYRLSALCLSGCEPATASVSSEQRQHDKHVSRLYSYAQPKSLQKGRSFRFT